MFEINNEVMYGVSGVCKIVDIRMEDFGTQEKNYYVLQPVGDKDATIYVPVDNPKSVSKMKDVLTKEQVYELIHLMPQEELIKEGNSKIRKDIFSQIIKGGDRLELIRLIKTVHFQKKQREKEGKKVWATDENAMKKAEKILYEEIAVVLHLQYEDVLPFIRSEIEKAECAG